MKTALTKLFEAFSSLWMSCTLLMFLALDTWLGTLAQVDKGLFEAQKQYFESFIVWHDIGISWLRLPLPGANLLMCILFVNLLCGGMIRLRRGAATIGVLITHFGIAFLLIAAFVKSHYSQEGHVTLYPGERSSHFESYYRWELSITESLGGDRMKEYVIPEERISSATGKTPAKLVSAELPFTLEIHDFMPNSRVLPKGPMFDVDVPVIDGMFLRRLGLEKEAEQNTAGCYVSVVPKDGARVDGIVWGLQNGPFSATVDGRRFGIDLHHERYPMPFAIVLDEFRKENHPRSEMARSFESDVTVVQSGSARPVKISMNAPLRQGGLVVYQASWGPSNAGPGDRLFSTFAVVKNPADQFPLWACIVIAVGMVVHFARKLYRTIRVEARNA